MIKPRHSEPSKVTPKNFDHVKRTTPKDHIIKQYHRRLTAKETPGSVQMQADTHTAMKQIALLENKKLYQVQNEMVEHYIKHCMPNIDKKLIIENVRQIQKRMPSRQRSIELQIYRIKFNR